LIAIAEVKPFGSVTGRLLGIMVLLVIWGLNNLRLNKRQAKQEKVLEKELLDNTQTVAVTPQTPDGAIITKRFNEAIKTLQTAKIGNQGGLYKLPWYVVIGMPGSGKTTALKNSGLEFPLHSTFGDDPVQGAGGTRYCDWWFTNQAVLIDTAGRYTAQDDAKKKDNQSWLNFLQLIQKGRPKRPLNGIIVTLSVQDLINKTNTQKSLHATAIKQRIQELNHQLKMELPVYVMVTKTDTIAGFSTFFADMEAEERQQPWGFQFPRKLIDEEAGLASYFNSEYQRLLSRLSHRILHRLDHERSQQGRNLAYQFPQQMAALGPSLELFLKNIFMPNQFERALMIRGVYFISGTQSNRGSQWLSASLDVPSLNAPNDAVDREPKTFFIQDLLKTVVFKEANIATVNEKTRRRFHWLFWASGATAALLFCGVVGLWYKSFHTNQTYIEQLRTQVNDYNQATDGGLIEARNWLSLATGLNHLRNLTSGYAMGVGELPWQQHAGLFQGRKLGTEAATTYKKALQAFLIPDIADLLAEQVRKARNDEHLYEALKFYLMPHYSEHFDEDTYKIWVEIALNQKLPGSENDILRKQLLSHLTVALSEELSPAVTDQPLVDKAREQLVLTPIDLRIYRRLKNDYLKDNTSGFSVADVLGKKSEYLFYRQSGKSLGEPVPSLFTYNGFHANYNIQNKQLASRLANEQWIYGDSIDTQLTDERIADITAKVDDYYFADYTRYWEELLADIRIKSFNSVSHGQAVLRLLSASDQPLVTLVEAIRKHTALSEVPVINEEKLEAAGRLAETFASSEADRLRRFAPVSDLVGGRSLPGQRVADYFAEFNDYAQTDDGLPLAHLQASIEGVYQHFGELASSGNVSEAAFSAVSSGGSEPIKTLKLAVGEADGHVQRWFNDISSSANIVTTVAARGHVNNTWQAEVMDFYNRAIANRYPIDPLSIQEIKHSDFVEFFGPAGVLQSYFDDQLAPFVDQSRTPWRWKSNIGVDARVLANFQQADRIQQQYFTSEGEMAVGFLLKPLALDKIANGVILEMGGQSSQYNHGPLRPARMQWPGDATKAAKLTFTLASKGTPVSARQNGAWAWFRLIEGYTTERSVTDDGNLRLEFNIDGITAQYELSPNSSFNPFIANAAANFSLPEQL
jgi:type VI secretion system protein ImpL